MPSCTPCRPVMVVCLTLPWCFGAASHPCQVSVSPAPVLLFPLSALAQLASMLLSSVPGAKPGVSERKMTPFWINSPDQVPEQERQRKQQGTKEFTFPMPYTSSMPTAHRGSLAPPRGPWPPYFPSLSSPSGTAWGPPTAFDLLKSIWLVATPPPPRPWGVGLPQPLPQPSSPLLPRTSVLDWSPSPPSPLPSLSWVVAQSSPEAWSFPPMRLY